MKNLGMRLRQLRTHLNLSQSQLGLIGGVGSCDTGKWNTEGDYPTRIIFARLRQIPARMMLELSQSWSITLNTSTTFALLAETRNSGLIHGGVGAQ